MFGHSHTISPLVFGGSLVVVVVVVVALVVETTTVVVVAIVVVVAAVVVVTLAASIPFAFSKGVAAAVEFSNAIANAGCVAGGDGGSGVVVVE